MRYNSNNYKNKRIRQPYNRTDASTINICKTNTLCKDTAVSIPCTSRVVPIGGRNYAGPGTIQTITKAKE